MEEEALRAGDRVILRQDGAVCELEIQSLAMVDAGEYLCVCGLKRKLAMLTIKSKDHMWPHGPVAWCWHIVTVFVPSHW